MGHPDYEVTAGGAQFKGGDLLELDPEERARAGLFMSFQSPVEVPGVSNIDFLRASSNACRKRRGEAELVSVPLPLSSTTTHTHTHSVPRSHPPACVEIGCCVFAEWL